MNDASHMDMTNSLHQLQHRFGSPSLRNFLSALSCCRDVAVQLSTGAEMGNKIDLIFGAVDLIEFQNVRVIQICQVFDLLLHACISPAACPSKSP